MILIRHDIYHKVFFIFQVMCIQYWPSAKVKSEDYGDLNISVQHEEELANFHIRTIRIVHKKGTVRYFIFCRLRSFLLLYKLYAHKLNRQSLYKQFFTNTF